MSQLLSTLTLLQHGPLGPLVLYLSGGGETGGQGTRTKPATFVVLKSCVQTRVSEAWSVISVGTPSTSVVSSTQIPGDVRGGAWESALWTSSSRIGMNS